MLTTLTESSQFLPWAAIGRPPVNDRRVLSLVTNVPARQAVYYLIASAPGMARLVLFSLTTNFLWIWRKRQQRVPAPGAGVAHGR